MGERSRNIGAEAEAKVWKFLRYLGYQILETNNEDYDIDCIAEYPPVLNRYSLIKPRYAPEGLTAFEVTERSINKNKILRFKEKILRYNEENPEKEISGGVLIVDQRISASMMEFMKNQGIWGWGISRQRLYQEKLRTYNEWREIYSQPMEVPLNDEVSFLLCSTPPPTKWDKLIYIALFFDDSFHRLSLRRLVDVMKKIKNEYLSPLLKIGIFPINVHFECHSIGGVGDIKDDFKKYIIEEWRKEGINVIPTAMPFRDYRTFATMS